MDLSIVIPFYNEEDNAVDVLNGIDNVLKNSNIEYEIIAVDNGSLDKTGEILQGLERKMVNLKIVRIPVNEGYGWGVRRGLERSSGEYVGFMCGDNQVDARILIEVYSKARGEALDLCKVRRIKRYDGFARSFVSFFYNIICPALFSIKANDLNGTPKIFKKSILEKLSLVSKGWFIDAEIMIKCSKMGCRIGEVPVTFNKREKGHSKINVKAVLSFLKEMFSYRRKM